MKKLAHNIKISVFVHEDEEDPSPVEDTLVSMLPFEDLDEEKISIDRAITTGAKNNRIFIISVYLTRNRQVNHLLEHIKSQLGVEQCKIIVDQADSRLDEGMCFFIRVDKNKMLESKVWELTDSGNCFHIRITLAAFPAKKEVGIKLIKEVFS